MTLLPACGGGAGAGGFGALPFGSGYAIGVLSAHQVTRNAVDVTFFGVPKASDPMTFDDALNTSNWDFVPIDPPDAADRLVQFVERQSPSVIRVFADLALDPDATYLITASGISALGGGPISPLCTTAEFATFDTFITRSATPVDELRVDMANPQVVGDAPTPDGPLATYQINDRGDYVNESGTAYYRKRILRRAMTSLGGFFHLPDYGFAEPSKGLITIDRLRRMQSRAQAQVLREPDTVSASVSVTQEPTSPGTVRLKITAQSRTGETVTATASVDTTEIGF